MLFARRRLYCPVLDCAVTNTIMYLFIRIFNTIVSIVLGTVLNIAMDTALGAVLNVVLNSALNTVLLTLLCEYRIKYYNTEHRKSVDYVSRQICRL